MKVWAVIANGFARWIEAVAGFIGAQPWHLTSPRAVKLIEVEDDEFTIQSADGSADAVPTTDRIRIVNGQIVSTIAEPAAATLRGCCVELMLKPQRFLFRPFEVPGRAAEFLDGIIRAQIDRLTPWSASEAAFGWSKPNQAAADRIMVTVAATARPLVAPYVEAVARLGAQTIEVFATSPKQTADASPIKVMEERAAGFDADKLRQILTVILLAFGFTAAAAVVGSTLLGMRLAAQQDALAHRIAILRTASSTSSHGVPGSLADAQRALEIRKHAAPSSVMIIENLSRILPDNTYVTELRIENDKIQVVGVTHNAPTLIGLMEQSGLFSRATFFAPTTHSPSETGERFHIQVLIQPAEAPRS
ncbi:MAG: PilN domain-containing protein [Xanthobacteraceae bacterium]